MVEIEPVTVRLLNGVTAVPSIFFEIPANVTFQFPALVNVPLLIQSPPTVTKCTPDTKLEFESIVRLLAILTLPVIDFALVQVKTIL